MKKVLFLCIVIVTMAMSCKKERSIAFTVVDGRALEYNSTTPVAGAKVVLEVGSSVEQTSTTDANGKFYFEFEANAGAVYRIMVYPDTTNTKKRYYQTRPWFINNGADNVFDYPVTPYGYVKMKIKNVNPFDISDQITLGVPLPIAQTFGGTSVDTTIVSYVSGNALSKVTYWVYRNGQERVYSFEKSLPAHDTTYIEINY